MVFNPSPGVVHRPRLRLREYWRTTGISPYKLAMMLTLAQALTRATDQLSAHPALRATALSDAVLLLTHCLGIERATLIAHPERAMDREQQALYQRLLERRLRFEPVQYILGSQEFFGLSLRVTSAVLIPRPETEHLVEAVLARLPSHLPPPYPSASSEAQRVSPIRQQSLTIADVGTGSGAIAIALAHSHPNIFVTAIDLSAEALLLAEENARTHQLDDRICFLQSDLFAALADGSKFDVIVSNPPYIAAGDRPSLHEQVRDYEPAQALFSGPTGLEIYVRLIPQAFALLKPGGLLALEIGFGQRTQVESLLREWSGIEIVQDLQGIARVMLARR